MRVVLGWCALALCLLPALSSAQTVSESRMQVATVVDGSAGLSQPTGLRFLGNDPDEFFVIEKGTGRVKYFQNGSSSTVLDLPVASQSERGLLGIALHPDFGQPGLPNNDKVYLHYSRSSTGSDSPSGNWLENRLSMFRWNGSALVGEKVLAVFGSSNDGMSIAASHNGGPIKFGPDRMLYGVVGDLQRRFGEQNQQNVANTSSHVGGIFRLHGSGSVPKGNPYISHPNSDFHQWYAYGVRNSFGLDFDPATGNLWDTENGPASYDEINLVARGFNSGWTDIMGPDSRSSGSVSGLVNLNGRSRYSDPEFSYRDPVAVTAISFLHGSELGNFYNNKVLVGDANNGNLYLFRLNEDRTGFVLGGRLGDLVADDDSQWARLQIGEGFGIVTDLVRGPDGKTYVVNLAGGEIYRLERADSLGPTPLFATVPEPSAVLLAITAGSLISFCAWRSRCAVDARREFS